jgi:hypothetical protein
LRGPSRIFPVTGLRRIGFLRFDDGEGDLLARLQGLPEPPDMNRRTIRVVLQTSDIQG